MKVLITGATSGIGLSFAEYYARQGNNLIITGTTNKIHDVGNQLRKQYNIEVLSIILLIQKADDINTFLSIIENYDVDILINNAGFGNTGFFLEMKIDRDIQMVYLHNLLTMSLIHHFGNKMVKKQSGLIINVASLGGFLPVPQNSIYAATKSFIIKFTESLYLDLTAKKSNVRIIAVCPGFTRTNFHEKLGIPKDKQVDIGIFKWATPDMVVAKTFKDLKKGKVISITGGFSSYFQMCLYSMLPKKMYYKLVLKIFA